MNPTQLATWSKEARARERKAKTGLDPAIDIMGLSRSGFSRYARGAAPVPKIMALAAAHYALQLPAPAVDSSHVAFAAWFFDRFPSDRIAQLAEHLDCTEETIRKALRGYTLVKGERAPRSPTPQLLRALDWIYRLGSTECPYQQEA